MFCYRNHENGKTPQARIKKYPVNEFEAFILGSGSILHCHRTKTHLFFVT